MTNKKNLVWQNQMGSCIIATIKMEYPYKINSYKEYTEKYQQSIENPSDFWADVAQNFVWKRKWNMVFEQDFDTAKNTWFNGAELNITENALDRHLEKNGDKPAILWEPNEPTSTHKTLTYNELYKKVCTLGHVLKNNGIQKGDRVCIYMPMVPELAVAILACARVGAVHSVVFGGFSAQSIADRINDSLCKMVICTDGAYRGSKEMPMKETVDYALENCNSVERVLVLKHTKIMVNMQIGRDVWWIDEVETAEKQAWKDLAAEPMQAEDPLFILYTSGSTGKPKGVVHSCAGYMVWATYTFVNIFQYAAGDVHFCTADIGWITGHSYIIYGPLCAGATTLMFEGVPTYPTAARFWEICEKHKVNIFYTAPTAIRALMACGTQHTTGHNLSNLKVLGSVGEPINVEAWEWYNKHIGNSNLPIVDTWWQTETGGCMISNIAGITPSKPGFATLPMPGVLPQLVDETGLIIDGNGVSGNLVIAQSWPGIIRSTWGNHQRCIDTYFSIYKGKYFTGDGCLRDEEGMYRITGRVDDVMNVSGHRIGTAEVENAINMHSEVIESAIVGFPHDIKGQGIYAFVILESTCNSFETVTTEIKELVNKIIGPIAKPDKIQFVIGLPKTRSGKIMRRILRKIAEGDLTNLGDISTLLDPEVVKTIATGRL